jgi:DNA-binding XRE family transcriptional regulator
LNQASEDMNLKIFGQMVRGARTMLGYSRADLAKKAGLSPETITRIENANPSVQAYIAAPVQLALEEEGFEFPEGTRRLVMIHEPNKINKVVVNDRTLPARKGILDKAVLNDLASRLRVVQSNLSLDDEDFDVVNKLGDVLVSGQIVDKNQITTALELTRKYHC